ncbi:MAG TPA: hypothetical protein PLC04_00955 [Candidatus Kapabacteria bacterium]|nr:hypothetical protein [Candidatus Kapabacteria bacterium]
MIRNQINITGALIIALTLLFSSMNAKSQIILNNASSIDDTSNNNLESTFFDEISSNEYNFFYVITLEGCVSCNYAKLGAIRIKLKDKITDDNEFLIVKNYLNEKTRKKIKDDFKINKIYDKKDTTIVPYLDINTIPDVIVLDRKGRTILNESLYKLNDNADLLNKYFTQHPIIKLSKDSGIHLKAADSNISTITRINFDNQKNTFYLLDGYNFNIQQYDIVNGNLVRIYMVPDSLINYYKYKDSIYKDYYSHLQSSLVKPSIINMINYNGLDSMVLFLNVPKILGLQNRGTKTESNDYDTNSTLKVGFKDIAALIEGNSTIPNKVLELNQDIYSGNFDIAISYMNSIFYTGRYSDCTAESCKNLEGDKGAIFFKYNYKNDLPDVVLRIDDIRRITKKDYNGFYSPQIYKNDNGDLILFSPMNGTFLKFTIQDGKATNIQAIQPRGLLKQIFTEEEMILKNVKDFMKEYMNIKFKQLFYPSDIILDDNNIYVLLKENQMNNINQINPGESDYKYVLQIYSLKGKFIDEIPIIADTNQNNEIHEINLIGKSKNNLILLSNWDNGEYWIHNLEIK